MSFNNKEVFEFYNETLSYAAAARHFGIDYRTVKRAVAKYHEEHSFAQKEATRTGTPFDRISHYWLKTKNEEGDDVSLFVKNRADVMEYEEIRDKLIKDLEQFAPKVDKIKYPEQDGDRHMLVLDPADVHLGKLAITEETGGDSYNLEKAIERVFVATLHLLAKADKFNIENVVLIVGNDILHYDTPRRTTTSGTPQDTDGQWWSSFQAARQLYVDIIEMAKQIAPVTVVYCPSNHDYTLGFGLVDSLYSWYRNDENVTISNYGKSMRHRKYFQYGNNLIGVTHGDGAKNKDLPSLMQYEARSEWAQTKFSYWYVHHMHHKYRTVNGQEIEKDHTGVTVVKSAGSLIDPDQNTTIECIRSPSPADGWHSRNGYVNTAAIEAFIHHPTNGQIARLTSYC